MNKGLLGEGGGDMGFLQMQKKALTSYILKCEVSTFTAREGQEVQDVAMQATTRLKQALTNEREVKLKMQAQLELSQVCNIIVTIIKLIRSGAK